MITFARTKKHARNLALLMNSYKIPSKVFLSDLDIKERAKTVIEFQRGDFSNIIAVDMLNEGIDVPDVSLIVFARVTHSRRIFVQQLGRGLRIKKDRENVVHVLDFVADVRRAKEALKINREAKKRSKGGIEFYRDRGAKIVSFNNEMDERFFDKFVEDCSDLSDRDRVKLDFPHGFDALRY